MDPIIRLAQVSPLTRRIGRQLASAVVQPVVAPVALSEMKEEAPPVMACGCADELVRAGREYDAALARRDSEIDTLRKAAQQAAIGLTDAYTDAEERGYTAGEEKGRQAAGAAMRAQADSVKALAADISDALRRLTDEAEDTMVDIVFTAVCRILGEQGATRAAVQEMVRTAVAATRAREQLRVRLHPRDAVLFEEGLDGVVSVSADAAVQLGGCIIDGPGGSLDARLDTQLDALRTALTQVRAVRLATQEDQ